MKLDNKVAIVTGAGAGIGKAIAKEFAKEGAEVIVSTRRETNGIPCTKEIQKDGGKATFIKCDVSIEDNVKNLIDRTIDKFGQIDILVNNAGVNFAMDFIKVKPEDWDRVINTDLRGTYLCSWYVIPQMLKKGRGSIINIATVHTKASLYGSAPYDAAKWGMVGLTKALAVEFGSKGIRINALSPGLIATQIWDDILNAAPSVDECLEYWKANIPMARVGEPNEIAKAAVFLASDDSSYMTGANMMVDGGMTSQLISKEPYQSKDLEGQKR